MARPCQQVELTQNLKEYSNCKKIFQKKKGETMFIPKWVGIGVIGGY
jgi:hypothetical protein